MNVFALNKHESLKLLLLRLAEFQVNPAVPVGPPGDSPGGWPGSLQIDATGAPDQYDAMRLIDPAAPGCAAYIYTYGQSEAHFGVDLEYPAQAGVPGTTVDGYQEVALERLLDILQVHFDLVAESAS